MSKPTKGEVLLRDAVILGRQARIGVTQGFINNAVLFSAHCLDAAVMALGPADQEAWKVIRGKLIQPVASS